MPRIYDQQNNTHDFCQIHFPSEEKAKVEFGEQISYDDLHPDYSGDVDITYNCTKCNKKLTSKDN